MTAKMQADSGLRVDRWLWAARLFKTRAEATRAAHGGRVSINGQRVRPARPVRIGDVVHFSRGELEMELVVEGIARRRGPARLAAQLYAETGQSLARREARQAQRRSVGADAPRPPRRPDKRSRRQLRRLAGRE